MTNTITKILLALLALALMTAASAQRRTYYDSRGNLIGRSKRREKY